MSYNRLLNTKNILNKFRNNYWSEFKDCVLDLKPSYGSRDISGYDYSPINDTDRDFIYGAMQSLHAELDSKVFDFDVEKEFISPQRAIDELKKASELVIYDLNKLIELKDKYSDENGLMPYPISITIHYHQKVHDLFRVVLESDEIVEAQEPNYRARLTNENLQLKFREHWRTLNRSYRIRVVIYVLFVILSIIIYLQTSENTLLSILTLLIPFVHGLINKTKTVESFRSFTSKKLKEEKYKEFIEKGQQQSE